MPEVDLNLRSISQRILSAPPLTTRVLRRVGRRVHQTSFFLWKRTDFSSENWQWTTIFQRWKPAKPRDQEALPVNWHRHRPWLEHLKLARVKSWPSNCKCNPSSPSCRASTSKVWTKSIFTSSVKLTLSILSPYRQSASNRLPIKQTNILDFTLYSYDVSNIWPVRRGTMSSNSGS